MANLSRYFRAFSLYTLIEKHLYSDEVLLNNLREQALGLGKDWGDVSYETAWYRGRTLTGLQIGEPFPFLQVWK